MVSMAEVSGALGARGRGRPATTSTGATASNFFALVPEPGVATLEIGCGEGRVSRELGARGHRVTAVDVAPTLLEAARDADPDGEYVLADALPFADRSFDLVVAHNSLMDVDDLGGTVRVREAARVLGPGGRFCVCVTQGVADRLAGHRFPCSRGRPLESSTVTTRPITAAIASATASILSCLPRNPPDVTTLPSSRGWPGGPVFEP